MTDTLKALPPSSSHPLASYIDRLKAGGALLPDTSENVTEVVGILKSYGVVLDAYYRNLLYIAEHQFLVQVFQWRGFTSQALAALAA
jgi:CO2 hydration protein (ChpXY)